MNNVLVIGGAGYIGAHTCMDLFLNGFRPIVYDNLSNGHREFVKWGPLEKGDIRDSDRLTRVFAKYRPCAAIHFAGLIEVGQSILDPLLFFEVNVGGTISVLRAAEATGCCKIVFSSTCATYGIPDEVPLSENHAQWPISPYGRSKLMIEEMLRELSAHRDFSTAILRYFNAAGAALDCGIGEWHEPETHILPLAIETALGFRDHFVINGCDYDTPDGTCVRDFVHVMDLAHAHTRAVQHLLRDRGNIALNLGTGVGTSVQELLEMVEMVSGRPVLIHRGPRRAGDPPVLVADASRAWAQLGWKPSRDLAMIVESAWTWHRSRTAVAAEAI